jgi:hypothetical protein
MTSPGYGSMRASHADRERAIDVLKAAFAEGRLDAGELAERTALVQAARTYGELALLVADLPVGPLGTLMPGPPPPVPMVPMTYPAVPPARQVPAQPPTSGLAVWSMIFGAAAVIVPLLAVPAVAFGFGALAQIRRGQRRGRMLAVAGIVLPVLFLLPFLR